MIAHAVKLLVADEVWLVVAKMHQSHPDDEGFAPSKIIAEARKANLAGGYRPGISVHVHLHMVANVSPNPARYRMLFKLPGGDLRLYRPGDPAHPDRNGKMTPDRAQLPEEYGQYLDWYDKVYCGGRKGGPALPPKSSFIDRLSGLGKSVWRGTSADDYVSELRKGWE